MDYTLAKLYCEVLLDRVGRYFSTSRGKWTAFALALAAAIAVTVLAQTYVVSFFRTSPCSNYPCMVVLQNRAIFAQPVSLFLTLAVFTGVSYLAWKLELGYELFFNSPLLRLRKRVFPKASSHTIDRWSDFCLWAIMVEFVVFTTANLIWILVLLRQA